MNEPDEDRIKIGIRRLQAISNVLSYSTSKSYDTLQMHLVWAGDYAMSALSDDVLGSSFIWPNSLPPEQALADQAALIARDAAAHSHRDLITKGVTVKPMMYEELRTASQHEQLIDSVCTCFEDEVLHWSPPVAGTEAHRATVDQRTSDHPALGSNHENVLPKQDLKQEEFEEIEKAILYGDAMDA